MICYQIRDQLGDQQVDLQHTTSVMLGSVLV